MRRGYVGVALILLFSLGVGFFLLNLPDVRFYKDISKRIASSRVELYETAPDADDFISASVLSFGVSESSVGLSFYDFARTRKSREETGKIQRALTSSGWDFPAGALADMFVPVTNGDISALVPDLSKQIEKGYLSPNVLVVEGNVGVLRNVWNAVAGQIMSQTDISFMETLW